MLLLCCCAFRLLSGVCVGSTVFAPDEYWQSLEVAHEQVFGSARFTAAHSGEAAERSETGVTTRSRVRVLSECLVWRV